jgi:hypothetical protein
MIPILDKLVGDQDMTASIEYSAIDQTIEMNASGSARIDDSEVEG